MAEEDEIDVLGDFSTDCLNLLSKNESTIYDNSSLMSGSEILNLNDYTIHPQWLLDKPSTNPACWYNSEFGLSFEQTNAMSAEITTESITDESGWTEKEKDLIKRGIEIFGKSHVRLSQFIGSRTPAEVRYFLKNFYSYIEKTNNVQDEIVFDNCLGETITSNANVSSSIDYNEVLNDTDIPASIEEVIASVSTAKPTVNVNKSPKRAKSKSVSFDDCDVSYEAIPSGQSLLKSNYLKIKDIKKSPKHSFSGLMKNRKPMLPKNIQKTKEKQKGSKVKFKTNILIPKTERRANFVKTRRKSSKSLSESSDIINGSEHEIVTGKGLSVPVCSGEKVVKIQKESSDCSSESDIDVEEVDDGDGVQGNCHLPSKKVFIEVKIKEEPVDTDTKTEEPQIATEPLSADQTDEFKELNRNKTVMSSKKKPDLSSVNPHVMEQLMDTSYPTSEVKLTDEITDLEKFIHHEFFEGRPTKTPSRYLKIRNHIINNWNISKPTYVTKTSVRNGLKQCGDVNCIGRIHSYLEQIGAINFGCAQTRYVRPLYDIIISNNITKEKVPKDIENDALKQKLDVLQTRPRFKKKYVNDGEGGCTYLHDERGDVINTTVISEEPTAKRNYIKKPTIRLIYCRSFTDENPQKYTVQIDLSVVLLMDLHAHTSLTEVMGLVGGFWYTETRTLHITRYEPCRNIAPSSTHCDMCPVTQAQAAEKIHNSGLDVLGWFHSHPTFAPEPSQQDIDTQLSVQQWLGSNTPCIGIILSPFSGHGALIASPFRCLIVDKRENFQDQLVPYKFKTEMVSDTLDVLDLLNSVDEIINSKYVAKENKVDFTRKYFLDNSLTFLEKFLTSVKMHLAKCSTVNKMTCDSIIQGIINICSKKEYNNC